MEWLIILLAFSILVVVGRWSLWFALFASSAVLGLFFLDKLYLLIVVLATVIDPTILALSLAVGLVPVLGGAMERAGLLDRLVESLRIGRRGFLMTAPAMVGLLPVPGGALLSAPLVEKGGAGLTPQRRLTVNVWFRHALNMVYPLGTLLPVSKMVSLDLYAAVLYAVPGFALMTALGCFFLLRDVEDRMEYAAPFEPKGLLVPAALLLIPPVLHVLIMRIWGFLGSEIPMLISVLAGTAAAFAVGRIGFRAGWQVVKKAKPWRYSLIILGIFVFMNVFKATGAAALLSGLPMNRALFLVVMGAGMGAATGRVALAFSILLPVYFAKFGVGQLLPLPFAVLYFSTFMGYAVSPVHPCVAVTLEYFKTPFAAFFRNIRVPFAVSLGAAFLAALAL